MFSSQEDNGVSEVRAECPEDFGFPFQPYSVQTAFMAKLFTTIEQRGIGIFESPTGTGKSLSLICGSLSWLKEHKKVLQATLDAMQQSRTPKKCTEKVDDWLACAHEETQANRLKNEKKKSLEAIVRKEISWQQRKAERAKKRIPQRQEGDKVSTAIQKIDKILKDMKTGGLLGEADADLILDEYESGEEDNSRTEKEPNGITDHVLKVIYCTRTHSQASQFIKEVKRSGFGSSIRLTALASRQNLCVFEPVKNLKSMTLLNERCLELQKGKSSTKPKTAPPEKKRVKKDPAAGSKCPYFEKEKIDELSTEILMEVHDIEDVVKSGVENMSCPYYASRLAVPDAEIVVAPYNSILHGPTRKASGISLKDNVVIVDEAHNLIDAIASMYSVELQRKQVEMALWQVEEYRKRYEKRLSPNNLERIENLVKALKCLQSVWPKEEKDASNIQSGQSQKGNQGQSEIFTIVRFISETGLECVNIYKILEYCRKSLLSRKLVSFAMRYADQLNREATGDLGDIGTSPLMAIEGFLETLTNSNKDGRVLRYTDRFGTPRLKFLLLNPAVYVKDIFQEARSVVFAGGTMQPISDFEDQLLRLAGVDLSRVHHFSCGHVIPPHHVMPIVVHKGPSGQPFEFKFQNRGNQEMISQLGRLILNVINIVPGGLVCFFPSYDFEEAIVSSLAKAGDLQKIGAKKQIFREPKKSSDVDTVLNQYASSISMPAGGRTGAILFAVVGGKLSEGINFSDDLARCVIMVGLPFPNANSVELKEKMRFLDENLPKAADGRPPSKQFYENLCMKAVNQSIGRAIRHARDYATILLVDQRYASPNIRKALPGWIADQVQVPENFGGVFCGIKKFFTAPKE